MKFNNKQKTALKVFATFFIFSFIIINWTDVSWIFNYKEWEGLTYDFFNPYEDSTLLVKAQSLTVTQNPSVSPSVAPSNPTQNIVTAGSDSGGSVLLIPSIGVNTPVVVGRSTDNEILHEDLDRGAVYYPGSVLPGKPGQIIVLGHSAPPNWPRIKHDYIFSNVEDLKPGDQIVLQFNNTQYIYKVKSKQTVKPGQDVGSGELTGSNNILTLVSCWPPGKDYLRIAINAELVR
jgi:LPXTG-site transpeptidase (sortase) family protein